jgi:hypothetical protein
MATGLGGNNEEQAKILVVNAPLPPSGVDLKFLKVERNHIIFHADVPLILHNLDALEWKDTQYLKRTFKTPPTSRQWNPQQTPYSFPCCLLEFGPAVSLLPDKIIVINWWLNLTKEQQKATWEMLKVYFLRPTVSAELINQYNPNDPKVQGVLDKQPLRVK